MEVFKHLRLQRPSATSCAQTLPKLDQKKKVNVLLWLMWVMMIFNLSHTGLLVAMLPMLLKVPWTLTVTSALPHIFSFSPIIVSRQ